MLSTSDLITLLGYADSAHFRTSESQFEPESVQHFRLAKERHGDDFTVKGFYVLETASSAQTALAARPAVCIAQASSESGAKSLHRRIWNLGNVPFLVIRLPDHVRIYCGFRYENSSDIGLVLQEPLDDEKKLRAALTDFTADSIDSAQIWQSQRQHLDTRRRVNTQLLENLKELAQALAKHCSPVLELPIAHTLIGKFVYLRYLRDRNILDDEWLKKRNI